MNFSSSYAYNSAEEQGVPLIVSTDKKEYSEGDIITISGAVRSPVAKTPLTLQIIDNRMNLVHIEQVDLSQDGTYAVTFKAGGDLWKNFGTYTVRAQYGFHHVYAETSFDLIELVEPSKQMFHVGTGYQEFDIPYTIKGATVNDMQIDYPSIILALSINAIKNGVVTLDIPRDFMDSKKMDGSDEKFIVLINGTEVDPVEKQGSPISRNVTINFLEGDSKIELIGTQIVPEFGSLAAMIMAISIISVVIISRRIRFHFSQNNSMR